MAVAADEQKEQVFAALRVIHAVAGAHIDLQFGHAVRQVSVRTGIAMNEPINAHQDACPADGIA